MDGYKERYSKLDRDNKLIWNLRDIGHIMRTVSEGKGSQNRILIVLSELGSTTQRELTEYLGIQPGSASEVIGKLESAGWIVRKPSEKDRRTTDITLTKEGKAKAKEAASARKKRHEEMFACLSEDEKENLLVLLEKLNDNWNRWYEDKGFTDDKMEGYRH